MMASHQDHETPTLIWNHRTKEEFREALETEIRYFDHEQELAGKKLLSWNYLSFEVSYPTLETELRCCDIYLRILVKEGKSPPTHQLVALIQVFKGVDLPSRA